MRLIPNAELIGLGLLLIAVGGCTGLLRPNTNATVYTLTAPKFAPAERGNWHAVIEEPLASGLIASTRVVTRLAGNELRFLDQALWPERATRMVQRLLVESLEGASVLQTVSISAAGIKADVHLASELRRLELEFDAAGNAVAHVVLSIKLTSAPTRQIIAARLIEHRAAAAANDPAALIAALDAAVAQALRDTVELVDQYEP